MWVFDEQCYYYCYYYQQLSFSVQMEKSNVQINVFVQEHKNLSTNHFQCEIRNKYNCLCPQQVAYVKVMLNWTLGLLHYYVKFCVEYFPLNPHNRICSFRCVCSSCLKINMIWHISRVTPVCYSYIMSIFQTFSQQRASLYVKYCSNRYNLRVTGAMVLQSMKIIFKSANSCIIMSCTYDLTQKNRPYIRSYRRQM